jgi:hypothetical protein
VKKRGLEQQKPTQLSYKGKRLHVYTYPPGVKGGIFSKTHIKIDGDTILNVRIQMIPPQELWGKKEP